MMTREAGRSYRLEHSGKLTCFCLIACLVFSCEIFCQYIHVDSDQPECLTSRPQQKSLSPYQTGGRGTCIRQQSLDFGGKILQQGFISSAVFGLSGFAPLHNFDQLHRIQKHFNKESRAPPELPAI